MIKNLLRSAHLIFTVPLIIGCGEGSNSSNDQIAATVGSNQLSVSTVEAAVPDDLSAEDSLVMAENFVRNWVTKNLLLEKAEQNLSADQLNVTDKLEEYRQSLLIYQYQREYVRQQMDTTVSDVELEEYYDSNKENFKLKDNIARMLFVRLLSNSKDVAQVKKLCRSTKEEDREELNAYCQQHAIKFMLTDGEWNIFDDVLLEIPEELYGNSNSLFRTGTFELSDTTGHYILSIKETKARNEVAPLEFETSTIKGIILNKRKIDLVKSLEQQIFDEGLSKNHVRIE